LTLQADQRMPPGREGQVYPDPTDPAFVIKVRHKPDDEWRDKIAAMLSNSLNSPDIAWPTGLVYAPDRTTLVGYRMPFAANKKSIAAIYSTNPATKWMGADYGFRLDVAINLATAYDRVASHSALICDNSKTNTLVGRDASVCIIDADSFQFTRDGRTFRCQMGTPEYTPAEFYGLNFAEIDRNPYGDAFALPVHIFELLVGPGTHPFMGRFKGAGRDLSLTERIQQGVWPYSQPPHPDYEPRTAAPFDLLHPRIQPLMVRCFQHGHTNPAERPLPSEWVQALQEVKQDLDFVRVIAPNIEVQAHAQHQATLAAATKRARVGGQGVTHQPGTLVSPGTWLRAAKWGAGSVVLLAVGLGTYSIVRHGLTNGPDGNSHQPVSAATTSPSPPSKQRQQRTISPKQSDPLPTPNLYRNLAQKPRS
jgi:DNA-binding helix-hairpin-helix protein with protein kinase domain